ncbi:hypothetical protein TYRP_011322 [Tyrophagus putrescentiae]|nr:hypothetical protein TYRP_011322 [Tyrophagus putrescentiae]
MQLKEAVFVLVFTVQLASAYPGPRSNYSSLSEALADVERFIVRLQADANVPAITFGLSVRGKTILEKAFGYSDLENAVPAKVTTRFRLASLSKSFTAALIGSLVERGLISGYGDSVHKYLREADFPRKTWKGKPVTITLDQLLSHRAGTFRGDDGFDTVVWAANVTQCIHKRRNEPLLFEPGTAFSYSNYGFELLGAVVEAVTREPYDVVMHRFLRQHRLNTTVVETMHSPLIYDRARYYREDKADRRKNAPSPVSDELYMAEASWSDGNLLSNVPELLAYGNLMINAYKGRPNGLVSQKTMTTMWTSHTVGLQDLEEHGKASYGYAWFVYNNSTREKMSFEVEHRDYVTHSGGAAGLTSWMNVYPADRDKEIVAVALSNKGDVLNLGETAAFAVDAVAGFF